MVIVKG